MKYFATAYTIHFDDTMAYGSHHFLTSFKFQCASRESLLFGEHVFDAAGVPHALDGVHLLTADAYARNLSPARLGDRVAILLTLEDCQRASARFCYRVISAQGEPICAGFQTLLCADATTGEIIPLPTPLREALERLREIEEPFTAASFRERNLAGGSKTESLFGPTERETAKAFLSDRYPKPQIVSPAPTPKASTNGKAVPAHDPKKSETVEAWMFGGQGVFDAELLSSRIAAYANRSDARDELEQCAAVAAEMLGGDPFAVISGCRQECASAIEKTPELSQFAIHLQNVLGARLRQTIGRSPAFLAGHSFGEIAAFSVAGCFDLATGVRVVCRRVRAIAENSPSGGGLLAVAASRSTVATEMVLHHLQKVVIAGRNHEQQTVVSGPLDQLEHLREALRQLDIGSVVVPSPTSFHHPCLRAAAATWQRAMKELPLGPPSLPLFTPNGRRFITPEDDIAGVLASQLLKPFDLLGAVNDLIAEGATTFVDCGSTGSLERLISRAAPDGTNVTRAEQEADKGDATRSSARSSPKSKLNGKPKPAPVTAAEESVAPRIAIVGQGCILPAGATSPEALFSAIMEQRSGIVDQRSVDPHWSEDFYSEKLVPDRSTSHLTGRVNDVDIVAPPGIDEDVFRRYSRGQKLLCLTLAPCAESLIDAGRVLCLIGATADGFDDHDVVTSLRFAGVDLTSPATSQLLENPNSITQEPYDAVREVVDHVLRPGLEVMLVDAACASSLYTVAMGVRALEAGEVDAVIAGGVFCPGPGNSCLFSQFRGTTATGLRPFDASADGVVFSEGSAVIALRRSSDAVRYNLPVSAIVKGFGLSSDGRSSSANVPQTHGQILSLQRCYANYRIDPASIDAIEGHGTSTPVGDATELETLRQFYSSHVDDPLPLHSLKGLLGHAGWAAGTASIIAACEYLRQGCFPAQAALREPSKALTQCSETLRVPSEPLALSPGRRRIAIDGFGFGGSNGHVVLESNAEVEPVADTSGTRTTRIEQDDELVFVATHELVPDRETRQGRYFDRSLSLAEGHVLLPDLADDMDISQKLAVLLADGIASQLPRFDDDVRRETGVVLALRGKTERGIEATMRVLADRLRRQFADDDLALAAIDAAYREARPSGPYTLQCMMPNVAAGRAALQFNLNGPNFAIDAGDDSLESAITASALLLRGGNESGTKLVIVAAIKARSEALKRSGSPEQEFAAAIGVTTRGYANDHGMRILSTVEDPLRSARESVKPGSADVTYTKLRALLRQLGATTEDAESTSAPPIPSDEDDYPIHVPIWVETSASQTNRELASGTRVLAIAPARQQCVAELARSLPGSAEDHRILVVGPSAHQVAARIDDPKVISVDLENEHSIAGALRATDEFEPELVLAVDTPTSWDRNEVLAHLATDNSLCEMLFLVARHHAARLNQGRLDLFALLVDGWRDEVHPSSGPLAGLLKSIQREIASTRVATICTGSHSLPAAIECALAEHASSDREQEIVYDGENRLARRLRRVPIEPDTSPLVQLDSNSVVLATGGARGVTAVLAEALLNDHNCTVVAVGRSVLEKGPRDIDDPRVETDFYARAMHEDPNAKPAELRCRFEKARANWEAHRTIERLSATGGCVDYVVADLMDREQVSRAVDTVLKKYGRIDLILHGAGVQVSKQLCHRTLADFRRTFSIKVAGLHNLIDECTARLENPVATHVLTSAYSVFGNDGQHDYGAANETLDRLCTMNRHGTSPWSSIAWLAWDGIGMTRGSEYHALSKQRGLSTLTVADGQKIFRKVLAGQSRSNINVPMSPSEHARYVVKTVPTATQPAAGRLLEQKVELAEIACLPYHKVHGVPTLPGAWILDQMVLAGLGLLDDASEITRVTIQDASFHRFVKQSDPEPNLRVVAEACGEQISVWMIGNLLHASGAVLSKDIVFAQATVSFQCDASDTPSSFVALSTGQTTNRFLKDPYCPGRHNDVELSGPFDCVRDIVIDEAGRRARYVPSRNGVETHGLPGLVLDAALRVGAMYAGNDNGTLYVPLRIGRLIAPVGERARAFSISPHEIRTTAPHVENGHVRWDLTEALDEQGSPRLVLHDALATRLR